MPLNHKQVGAALPNVSSEVVIALLDALVNEKLLTRQSRGKYLYVVQNKTVEGVFVRRTNGRNSLLPNDGTDPIRVPEQRSGHALDGDIVRVLILPEKLDGEPIAEVVDIIQRNTAPYVGILSVENGVSFLLTDTNKLANDIYIPAEERNGARNGYKVMVQVTDWPKNAKNPVGKVLDVIGKAGENDTEMHAILAEFGLPFRYPKEVEEAAEKIDEQSAYEPKWNRKDFRDRVTFTIDPKDAKDFDDALSLKVLDNNTYEVGVHIADVTAYVLPGDKVDHEAQQRATSVYLVDRTVPMLPERLCNNLCSLRPNVDRPAYSVIFTITNDARITDYYISRTIIHSNARLTYEDAQAIIEGGDGDCKEEILILNNLAQQLRTQRMNAGAIDFERAELKFEINDSGKPIAVKVVQSKEANKLIEEFMLLANRTVAEFIGVNLQKNARKPLPFVYRVHDLPDQERLQSFAEFIMKFGHRIRYTGKPQTIAKSINELLDKVQGKPEENLVETLAIRTMSKAVYQTDNIGHYGLAFPYYTHFTSPIRRHPDMMVHRLLTHYIGGGEPASLQTLSKACEHDSKMEQTAAQAERASIKYKQVEYMLERVGQVFDGVISGVTEWGLYVELTENGCEGLIPIRELDDDYYEMDEQNYCLVGMRTHQRYSLGDTVTIRVASARLEDRQLDFELA